jgi:GT2 family glycosyltransferase
MAGEPRVGIVAIGRNEGERLKACLRSVVGAGPVVYVDSGSTDGSQDFARSIGVTVVTLAVPPNFTAARARNEGAAALLAAHPAIEFLQMVDGDCEVQPGWIAAATAALDADPGLAAVFGRRRERFPEASLYNALTDDEWATPIGEAAACGGDVLLRRAAFEQVGRYPDTMIAGEEPDMSARMRKRGWRLRRLDAEMTLHDAAMTRFGQWWNRARRAGHAYAELRFRHPDVTAPDWGGAVRRILLWGGIGPAVALAGLLLAIVAGPLWLLLPLGYVAGFGLNVLRIFARRRRDLPPRLAAASALLLMVGKWAEFLGLARFHLNRWRGRRSQLIEYKGPAAA